MDAIVREMETEMDRRALAADAFEAAVTDKVGELWEQIASPLAADKLDADWEMLLNEGGNILAMVAYVKRSGDKEALADMMIGLVNRKLIDIAKHEAERAGL